MIRMTQNGDHKQEDPSWEDEMQRLNQLGYPPALAKACMDEFSYALVLSTGEKIEFESARPINREWVHIATEKCERGLDVRVSAIVLVADWGRGF